MFDYLDLLQDPACLTPTILTASFAASSLSSASDLDWTVIIVCRSSLNMLLLLFELVFHIGVCLLAVTSESRAAPAVSEVQIPFTSGPCVLETEGTLRWNHEKQVIEVTTLSQYILACFSISDFL